MSQIDYVSSGLSTEQIFRSVSSNDWSVAPTALFYSALGYFARAT